MATATEQAETIGHDWVQVGPASSLAATGRMHTCIQVKRLYWCFCSNSASLGFCRPSERHAHTCTDLLLLLLPCHTCQQGRYVSVLKVKGQLTCIDSICFHAGGPLVSSSSSSSVAGTLLLLCWMAALPVSQPATVTLLPLVVLVYMDDLAALLDKLLICSLATRRNRQHCINAGNTLVHMLTDIALPNTWHYSTLCCRCKSCNCHCALPAEPGRYRRSKRQDLSQLPLA